MNETPGHRELRESLGAYVLGQLPADDIAELEAHLRTCRECQGELAELRPVAAAMAGIRRADAVIPEPSPDLGLRIGQRIRAEERAATRGRTLRMSTAAVLGAAAAALVLVVGLRVTESKPGPTVPLEAVNVVESLDGVQASANLVDHTWGVEVKLLASGLRQGGRYDVEVLGSGGAAFPAGAFVGTGAKPVKCNLNAGILRADASGFVVKDETGAVVLRSDFPA